MIQEETAASDEDNENEDGEEGSPLSEGEGSGGGGLSPQKLALFVGAPLIFILVVGAGLYFTGMLDGFLGKEQETVMAEGEHAGDLHHEGLSGDQGRAKGGASYFIEIPKIIVNLESSDDQPRYLRLRVQLEVGSESDQREVEAVLPRVIDQFQTYLRELRVRDLRGSAGIYRLQVELLSRVNAAAYPVEVRDVLFQEILIQ